MEEVKMPTYLYKAMTKQGQIVKNKITEVNKMDCIKRLKKNDLVPISIVPALRTEKKVKKEPRNFRKVESQLKQIGQKRLKENTTKRKTLRERIILKLMGTSKITARDIRIFTQNFYLLKKANFNNVHALTTVIDATENPKLKLILEDVLYGVEAGEFMHTTLEYYSEVFPYIYINMIKVGELSGSLELSLQQAIKYLDESEALRTKIKRILLPNIGMFIGITVLLFVCVIVGVPVIQDIFESIGTKDQLPWITRWFSGVVDKMMEYWYLIFLTIGGVVTGIIAYFKSPTGSYKLDEFKYTMPIFGHLIYLIDFSRLLKNMLLNLQNGIRIQEALEVSKNVIKNNVMLSMVDMAINNIYEGKSWIEPFEHASFSNPMTIEMLKIGMQTDLSEMMEKLVEYMDIDIDNALEKIVKVLPEVSYAIVGVVLIFFVVVVLVPCIQIYMGGFLFSAYEHLM